MIWGIDDKFAESLQFKLSIQDNAIKQLCITINEKIKGTTSPQSFDIKIRSDGFQWYYCFIMQLLYNPDTKETSKGVLFLLDEPGMYLNPHGQTCLLKRLVEIVNDNDSMKVIFSTHSHYMLDQDYIKPFQINIVEKNNQHFIKLYNLTNYPYNKTKTTPLTPLYEAIKVPFDETVVNNKKVILVEGIHDFYALKLFGNLGENYYIYPCSGATTIEKHIPFFIMRNVDFLYLVDNDFEGVEKAYNEIEEKYKTNNGIWLPFPGYINDDNTVNPKAKFEMDNIFNPVLKEWAKKLNLKSNKYTNVITYLYEHSEEDVSKSIISDLEEEIKQKFMEIKQKIEKGA